jgi:hypothetical protein
MLVNFRNFQAVNFNELSKQTNLRTDGRIWKSGVTSLVSPFHRDSFVSRVGFVKQMRQSFGWAFDPFDWTQLVLVG